MPRVVIERLMKEVDPNAVWDIARNLLAYPSFMDQVLSVEPYAVGPERNGTSWVVLFNGNELRWIEEDHYFESERRMTFHQIEGDLAEWRGSFSVICENGTTVGRYEVEFDLGIPALADVLHPLGERAIRANCEQMLGEMEARSKAHLVAHE